MVDVVIVYGDLNQIGGSENLCLRTIEVLTNEYDTKLITLREPDSELFVDYSDIDISKLDIHIISILGMDLEAVIQKLNKIILMIPGPTIHLMALTSAIRHRVLKHKIRSEGLTFCIDPNEIALSDIKIHYIHYPFNWNMFNKTKSNDFTPSNPILSTLLRVLDSFCKFVAGYKINEFRDSRILANSKWTATHIKKVFNKEADVVYPPVSTSDFSNAKSQRNREYGFVALGRITNTKNILRSIEIISNIRELGHDVHLHIVGPTINQAYQKQVEKAADEYDFVILDGILPRNQLIEMLQSHRYGIHGCDEEHFGIAIAEMISAGILPFIPNGGGQREIVNELDTLLYQDTSEAVEKIDRVLSNPTLEKELRGQLPDIEKKFGLGRFQSNILSIVEEEIERNT